jgi:hypothetical protein
LSLTRAGCHQNENKELGKFRKISCSFDLPEGLKLGENFNFVYVNMLEFHDFHDATQLNFQSLYSQFQLQTRRSLFGSSSRTLLAQHVIRDYPRYYPEIVTGAVLNGSVPSGLVVD